MKKIRVKLEVDKLRELIKTEEFTTKEGEQVKKQVIEFDLVEMQEKKFRTETDRMKVYKTHFACEPSKKKEDGTYGETNFIGDGIVFEWKNAPEGQNEPSKGMSAEDLSVSDIPF